MTRSDPAEVMQLFGAVRAYIHIYIIICIYVYQFTISYAVFHQHGHHDHHMDHRPSWSKGATPGLTSASYHQERPGKSGTTKIAMLVIPGQFPGRTGSFPQSKVPFLGWVDVAWDQQRPPLLQCNMLQTPSAQRTSRRVRPHLHSRWTCRSSMLFVAISSNRIDQNKQFITVAILKNVTKPYQTLNSPTGSNRCKQLGASALAISCAPALASHWPHDPSWQVFSHR